MSEQVTDNEITPEETTEKIAQQSNSDVWWFLVGATSWLGSSIAAFLVVFLPWDYGDYMNCTNGPNGSGICNYSGYAQTLTTGEAGDAIKGFIGFLWVPVVQSITAGLIIALLVTGVIYGIDVAFEEYIRRKIDKIDAQPVPSEEKTE